MVESGDWAAQQLAEFLTLVSSFSDEQAALACAAERAAEALEAEYGVAVVGGEVRASVGFPRGAVSDAEIAALRASPRAAVASLGDEDGAWLLVARVAGEPFHAGEKTLLRTMARVLSQSLRMLRALADERAARERSERLARIQRSISHRAPLQEVLDAITQGAHELLGDQVCGLRLVDPDHPDHFVLASYCGISDEDIEQARRGPLGQGAGGRAIVEDRLVIIEDYESEENVIPVFRANHMTAAMAAPVTENGRVVGSLVVASYVPGRRYSASEQEALVALAQHASLALTDAKTVEAMREAQRAKDLFLAMVSHELKTPLTVIMGTLRTLQSHGGLLDRETAHEMTVAAYARGEELRRLIDRLLRGARAELAGSARHATLYDLTARAVDGFAQSHRLAFDVPEDIDLLVDTVAFCDVVGILVENAVAHSPADAPVRVLAYPVGRTVEVCVSNPGALPADLDTASLFLPFHRGGDARSSGVGLGLYIAARLAESMGGHIDVASGAGLVTFTLTIPLQADPLARERHEPGDGAQVLLPVAAGEHLVGEQPVQRHA